MLAEVEAGGLVRSGPAGPELRPGCLHCSPDAGTDSGSVQREEERDRERQTGGGGAPSLCVLVPKRRGFDMEGMTLINLIDN